MSKKRKRRSWWLSEEFGEVHEALENEMAREAAQGKVIPGVLMKGEIPPANPGSGPAVTIVQPGKGGAPYGSGAAGSGSGSGGYQGTFPGTFQQGVFSKGPSCSKPVKGHNGEQDLVLLNGGRVVISGADREGAYVNKPDLNIDLHNALGAIKPFVTGFLGEVGKRLFEKMGTAPRWQPELLKIDWPDMKAPPVGLEWWLELRDFLGQLGEEKDPLQDQPFVVVFNCHGGHGRTGTALAMFMIMEQPEIALKDHLKHLRETYCAKAVETSGQERYLEDQQAELCKRLGVKDPNVDFGHGVES